MKLLLCSERESIRKRWCSILNGQSYMLHQVSIYEGIREVLSKEHVGLIMLHQASIEIQSVGQVCKDVDPAKVFLFSDEPKPEDGLFFLRNSVSGYASTYISAGRLKEAVKLVLSGKVWFNQEIIELLIKSMNVKSEQTNTIASANVLSTLSQREKEIAILVSKGLSNQSIAERLYISERTVKTHLSTIFHKTESSSRLQLALTIHGIKS